MCALVKGVGACSDLALYHFLSQDATLDRLGLSLRCFGAERDGLRDMICVWGGPSIGFDYP